MSDKQKIDNVRIFSSPPLPSQSKSVAESKDTLLTMRKVLNLVLFFFLLFFQ